MKDTSTDGKYKLRNEDTTMKLKVTFTSETGHEIVEMFDMTPHANGFIPDYKLRASALNWTIKNVVEVA